MSVNKFLEFNEQKNEMQTDEQYNADTQRIGGLQTGLARTVLHNKLFRQASVMVSALGKVVADLGKNADDTSRDTLAQNIKDTMLSAENHILSVGPQALYDSDNVDSALRLNMKMFQGMMFRELISDDFVSTYTCVDSEVLPKIVFCKDFVLPTGVTVSTLSKTICIIIALNSVTIEGTLDASGKGGLGGNGANSGAGNGGNGGGNVHIFTDLMYGSGVIKANGLDGFAATSYITTPSGVGIKADDGILPDGGIATGGWSWNANGAGSQGNPPCTINWDNLYVLGIFHMLYPKTTGGGGGGGGPVDSSTSIGYKGAQGGAGAGGQGGSGSSYSSGSDTGTGGGGGGGGGLIIIHCNNSIPTLTLEAKGGVGKSGGGSFPLNAGGGGGGAIICIAKAISAITSVSGGLGASGSGAAGVAINHLI